MRELFLRCGRVALISDIDYERCSRHSWRASERNQKNKPYIRTDIDKKTVYLHRFITNCPPTLKADHWDGNTFNNQRGNLRICTHNQNVLNRAFWSKSGYKGLSFEQGRYRVRITLGGETKHLGAYKDPVEAAQVYDDEAFKLFGEFAWLNFPERHPLPNYDAVPAQQQEIPF